MKRFPKFIGYLAGGLLLAGILGTGVLYFATRGEYPVLATVLDDPGLSSMEVNGVMLHMETFGSPENPAVIILHGGPGGDYRSLLALQELADEYFLVFYDQRGAGLSERVSADQLTLSGYLAELDGIIDHFGKDEPVILIGHSWGGMLASAYLGYAPEKVTRAVLAEPGFLNVEEMEDFTATMSSFTQDINYLWFALRTGFEARHVRGPDEQAPEDYLFSKAAHYFADQPENPYHCPGQPYDAPSWRFGSDASKSANTATPEEINQLESGAVVFQKPVLFLAGECNTWIGEELQAKHAGMYSNARLEVIPDAGHDMVWDNPKATLAVIQAFLDS